LEQLSNDIAKNGQDNSVKIDPNDEIKDVKTKLVDFKQEHGKSEDCFKIISETYCFVRSYIRTFN
jgi:hypothetical protein